MAGVTDRQPAVTPQHFASPSRIASASRISVAGDNAVVDEVANRRPAEPGVSSRLFKLFFAYPRVAPRQIEKDVLERSGLPVGNSVPHAVPDGLAVTNSRLEGLHFDPCELPFLHRSDDLDASINGIRAGRAPPPGSSPNAPDSAIKERHSHMLSPVPFQPD